MVEHHVANVRVASSNLVSRSILSKKIVAYNLKNKEKIYEQGIDKMESWNNYLQFWR